MVNSATCASKGLLIISSKTECGDAASYLGLNDNYAFESGKPSQPSGCIWNPSNEWLYMNTDTNGVTCGSVTPDGRTYNCICKAGNFKHFCAW